MVDVINILNFGKIHCFDTFYENQSHFRHNSIINYSMHSVNKYRKHTVESIHLNTATQLCTIEACTLKHLIYTIIRSEQAFNCIAQSYILKAQRAHMGTDREFGPDMSLHRSVLQI